VNLEDLEKGSRINVFGLLYIVEWSENDEIRAYTHAGNTIQLSFETARGLITLGELDWWNDEV